jgi:hypothetical protein
MCLQRLYRGSFLFTRKRQYKEASAHSFSSYLIYTGTKFPYTFHSPGLTTPDARPWGHKVKLLGSMPVNTWDLMEYHDCGALFEKFNE